MPQLISMPSGADWLLFFLGFGGIALLFWGWKYLRRINPGTSIAALTVLFIVAAAVVVHIWSKLCERLLLSRVHWVIWVEAVVWTVFAITLLIGWVMELESFGQEEEKRKINAGPDEGQKEG